MQAKTVLHERQDETQRLRGQCRAAPNTAWSGIEAGQKFVDVRIIKQQRHFGPTLGDPAPIVCPKSPRLLAFSAHRTCFLATQRDCPTTGYSGLSAVLSSACRDDACARGLPIDSEGSPGPRRARGAARAATRRWTPAPVGGAWACPQPPDRRAISGCIGGVREGGWRGEGGGDPIGPIPQCSRLATAARGGAVTAPSTAPPLPRPLADRRVRGFAVSESVAAPAQRDVQSHRSESDSAADTSTCTLSRTHLRARSRLATRTALIAMMSTNRSANSIGRPRPRRARGAARSATLAA